MSETINNDVQELNRIEQQLIKAWVNHERETIDRYLADDWAVTDPAGRHLTRAEVLAELDTGERKLDSGAIDDVHVRLYGDTAVVTGRTLAAGSYQGTSVSVKLRFTDVFVKQNGNWRVVASHSTLIGE